MDLSDAIAQVRARHAVGAAPSADDSNADQDRVAESRAIFAAFVPELQAAMRVAARRYDWDGETWAMQTIMLARAIEASGYDPAVIAGLAAAYQHAPQG